MPIQITNLVQTAEGKYIRADFHLWCNAANPTINFDDFYTDATVLKNNHLWENIYDGTYNSNAADTRCA